MFLAGATQIVLAMLFWLAELAGRAGIGLSAPLPLSIPSTWAHVLLMVYGIFIFFIYGFLFTVFPRWMGPPEIPRARYMTVWSVAVLGMLLTYAGLFTTHALLYAGLALYLGAWATAIATLLAIYRRAPKRGPHERLLLVEMTLGAAGVAVFAYAVFANDGSAFAAAREIGLWGFLVPVLLTVSQRMIPFFTQSALAFTSVPRPAWSLAWFVGGCFLHGVFELAAWPLPLLLVDAALAGIALHHTSIWGLRRSFAVRLLAMLHVGFLWFGVAMTLYAVQDLLRLADISALGRAPLHALTIGFVTGTLIAMATRVTLGHSGRALSVKAPTWYLFLALTVGVSGLRVGAEIFTSAYTTLNLLAAAGWLVCVIPWAARYASIYLRPRVDRRPG